MKILAERLVVILAIATSIVGGGVSSADAQCVAGAFESRLVGATTMQIVVAWQPRPGALHYVVERSISAVFSNVTSYPVSASVNSYGDTGWPADSKTRFHAPSGLSADTVYYYRIRARFASQPDELSDCVSAQLTNGPVRGVAGDLYADIVLGQPDFGTNVVGQTVPNGSQWAGGVHVDRSTSPGRMYLGDTNHNRILGFENVGGRCAAGVGINLAQGRPYTKSKTPSAAHPDSNISELTDGVDSTAWQSGSGDSFGYQNLSGSVDLTIDLGAPQTINVVSLNSGALSANYSAGNLEVLVSIDNVSFTSVATYDNLPKQRLDIAVSFPSVSARYVRFRVSMQSGCPDCNWLFLGEGRVGAMSAQALGDIAMAKDCSGDSDCADEAVCVIEDRPSPTIVLGQTSLADQSACNGDGTAQLYPTRAPASASSLCLIPPEQISIGETIFASEMDSDGDGNLFVSDLYNNRILRFTDPFETDSVADQVWGQADFQGNLCNRGANSLSPGLGCKSLCLEGFSHAGVTSDTGGNLWVADTGNGRVLRFPKIGGTISDQADVVLGQTGCTQRSGFGAGRSLSQMARPIDVAFDFSTGKLYVADSLSGPGDSRVLEFSPPFTTGKAATRALPISPYCDFAFPATMPTFLALDTQVHALWVQSSCFFTELFDLDSPNLALLQRQRIPQADGLAIDEHGSAYVIGKWSSLYRFPRRSGTLGAPEPIFPDPNAWISGDSFWFPQGVARIGDQIVVSDSHRLLIWNVPDLELPASHEAADDVYNEPDFTTAVFSQYYTYPQSYEGKLWVARRSGERHTILRFDAPLTNCIGGGCTPSRTVDVAEGAGYPLVGGGGTIIRAGSADWLDFAPARGGDEIWVADRNKSRVFRIANLEGARGAGGPFVDVILGQNDAAASQCNRGGSIAADTLCTPYDVSVDGEGNVYVADNGGEGGSNLRLLEFDAALFPTGIPASATFGPRASRVFGTGGSFTRNGFASTSDPLISPFKPALSPEGALVIGNNPYDTQRFPLVYQSPLAERLPQFALGDFTSYPSGSYSFDAEGNLYLADTNWSRVLIYKRPLEKLSFGPPRTPPPTPTKTPTDTPTLTPTTLVSCGDGSLDVAEQCDDGNRDDGDGCDASCRYELISGVARGGSKTAVAAGCVLEWSVVNPGNTPEVDRWGRRGAVQSCHDNDPACDGELDPSARACEMQVVVCLNNVDPSLPTCGTNGVADSIRILAPLAKRDPVNADRLSAAVRNLRDAATAETGIDLPVPATRVGVCSEPFALQVPLGRSNRVPGKLRIKTLAYSLGAKARSDRDTLTLRCLPTAP